MSKSSDLKLHTRMQYAKAWWQSKTIWVNAITLLIGVVSFLAGQEFIADHPQIATWFAMVLGLLNIVLRFLTNQPVVAGD